MDIDDRNKGSKMSTATNNSTLLVCGSYSAVRSHLHSEFHYDHPAVGVGFTRSDTYPDTGI